MSDYKCPKCGGTDYFMSQRTVMTGIGGVWGNRGGVKEFPACSVCNEIMVSLVKRKSRFMKVLLIIIGIYFGLSILLQLVVAIARLVA